MTNLWFFWNPISLTACEWPPCECPWPPFICLTKSSTHIKAIIPIKTINPIAISAECECPWDSSSWEWPWECSWPWSSESGRWEWDAWGIKCKNASPRRPPEAKARRILEKILQNLKLKIPTALGLIQFQTIFDFLFFKIFWNLYH